MAECEVKAHYTYTLKLTHEEAKYIRDLTRNNLLGASSNAEDPEVDHPAREAIFTAINQELILDG